MTENAGLEISGKLTGVDSADCNFSVRSTHPSLHPKVYSKTIHFSWHCDDKKCTIFLLITQKKTDVVKLELS